MPAFRSAVSPAHVDGGVGFIIGSSKDMTCKFIRKGPKTEALLRHHQEARYRHRRHRSTQIEWLVFSALLDQGRQEGSLARHLCRRFG